MASSSKAFTVDEVIDMIIARDEPEEVCHIKRKKPNDDYKNKPSQEEKRSENSVSRFYGTSRCITLSEAREEIESDENEVRNVTIIPPDKGDEYPTDEEDDFDGQDGLPGDIVGTLEINFELDNYEQDKNDEAIKGVSTNESLKKKGKRKNSESGKNIKKKNNKKDTEKTHYEWTKNVNCFQPLMRNGNVNSFAKVGHLEGKTPFDVWSLLFTPEMVDYITEQTMLYANRDKGDHSFFTTSDEIYKFLGVIIFSGYHHVPSEKNFWSTQPDLQVPFVANEISRNRYHKIKSNIHLADNYNLEKGNKVAKVQPIYDMFNKNLKQFGLLHSKLSIDESMVPYKGLHSIRQYMKAKPIKFGYKLWSLCGDDGYPYHLDIYCGKSNVTHGNYGLGGNVVLSMVDIAEKLGEKTNVEFFFDNFFSSQKLFLEFQKEIFVLRVQ